VRRRFLLDVNVVLDVLLDRKPNAEAAAGLWAAIERREAEGLLPAHGLTTIHYLAARSRSRSAAREMLEQLLSVFSVAAVDEDVLRRALSLPLRDFEDAVCAASAEAAECEAIVTRDPAGFRGATLPVIDPATAVAWLAVSASDS
jgi:predicted nucleic acid-binding protein